MLIPVVLSVTAYVAVGILVGRLAAHYAFKHASYSNKDTAAYSWGFATFLFWPPVLAVAVGLRFFYGAYRVLRLLIVPTEAR